MGNGFAPSRRRVSQMAKWHFKSAAELVWSSDIANLKAKQEVAERIAQQARQGDVIGFGSGSTSFAAIMALAARIKAEQLACLAIPTSAEVELACATLGIPTTTLLANRPDWAFDGADEVDPRGDVLKDVVAQCLGRNWSSAAQRANTF